MKRIYFHNLNKDKIMLAIIIMSLLCFFIGSFGLIEFTNSKINTYISKFGYLLLVLNLSKLFWHKNTVQYNKKGLVIRIKSFLGKSLRFEDIKSVEIRESKLYVIKTNGGNLIFDINLINKIDIDKLLSLLKTNTTT